MAANKTPRQMARVLLAVNPKISKGSIIRYMNFVINRAGKNMKPEHREKIREAMAIVRRSKHLE
jgi:hypothetical protein